MKRRELLLGCGYQRNKLLVPLGTEKEFQNVDTCDINFACNPDFVLNLEYRTSWLKFPDDSYDEIHAYEFLEHLGQQGDVERFFFDFGECYRILRDGGFLCASVPSRFSPWLWGDPGHRRAILPESLIFLDQTAYRQVGKTAISDYRGLWRGDFKIIESRDDKTFHWFILQAVKPARSI